MKERDRLAVRVLRSVVAAIDNAEAPEVDAHDLAGLAIERSPRGAGASEVARVKLSPDDVRAIVRRELDDRICAANGCERAGQAERAAQLRAEAAVLHDLGANAM